MSPEKRVLGPSGLSHRPHIIKHSRSFLQSGFCLPSCGLTCAQEAVVGGGKASLFTEITESSL